MTTSTDLDLWCHLMPERVPDRDDVAPSQAPPPIGSLALNPWIQLVWGPVAAALLFALVQGAAGWMRTDAVSAADLATVKAELAAIKIEQAAALTKISSLETTDRQRSVEIVQMAKTLEKIENYQGSTMKHVGEINIQLAEMRGERRKGK